MTSEISQPQWLFGADHAGFSLKQNLRARAESAGWICRDIGTHDETPCDYPDLAGVLATVLAESPRACGILICGSGIGMSMAANRWHHVRAALCLTPAMATLAREHNDANVLVLGARMLDAETAWACCEAFAETAFAGGRHAQRVAKLATLGMSES